MVTSHPVCSVRPEIRQSQDASHLSDFEIARRVIAIRSQWTVDERLERREEAARRFDSLLESLNLMEAGASA